MTGRQPDLACPLRLAVAAMLLSGLVLALGAGVLAHPDAFAVDDWWAQIVVGTRSDILTFVAARMLHPLGRFPFNWILVAVVALLLHCTRTRAAVVTLVAGETASAAAAVISKVVIDRPRPPDGLVEASSSAFPSGHSAFAAVTVVLVVGLFARRGRRMGWAMVAVALALAMAWSRTYLLVHWLTDVVGGLATGAAIGLGALACLSQWQRRG